MPVGQGSVVVVDNRAVRAEAIRPDPGLTDWIVQTLALSLALAIQSMGRPGLERQVFLVRFNEMEEANLAASEALHSIQRSLQQVIQTTGEGHFR